MKTVFDADSGELLGAHLIGPEVTELIAMFALARTFEATEAVHETVEAAFVEATFRVFLTSGMADHGVLRVRGDACGHDRGVRFSCKKRGVCMSCAGRRMSDTAAHPVDAVLPVAPALMHDRRGGRAPAPA